MASTISIRINASGVIVAGSYGEWVVQKTRPDILRKFQEVVEQHNTDGDYNLMAQYIHQCNAQNPT